MNGSQVNAAAIGIVTEAMRPEPDIEVLEGLLSEVPVGSLGTLVGAVAVLAAAVAGPSEPMVLQHTALIVAGDRDG